MDKASWWERRWFLALLVLASAVPLLWPETPPLVDVPGHMGRYRVQLDLANSPELQRYFAFEWGLVGNLGVDLLIEALGPILGLEPAVKLITVCIPAITVIGLIWVAREIHGRVPPTVMFAVPFVYGYSFNYGFLNFSLSLALSLNLLALWLHLTNQSRIRLRTILFVPLSCLVWVVHAFGWGVLGLLAFSAELVREHDRLQSWRLAVAHAALAMVPLAIPLVLMIAWRSGVVGGQTDQFFLILEKLFALVAALRDRWLIWDSFGVAVAVLLIGAARFDGRLELSRKLGIPAAILGLTFVVMPARIFGSAYADMRLAPLMFMVAILAIRPKPEWSSLNRRLAWLGLLFVSLRMIGNLASFAIADQETRHELQALNFISRGSPVLVLAGDYCLDRWEMPRHTHLASFVVIRKFGFANDQWQAAGAQLLRVTYWKAGYFARDRSTFVFSEKCIRRTEERAQQSSLYDHRLETALWKFPRDAFDFVWLVDVPDFDPALSRRGLTLIWRGNRSFLYRVERQPE